MSGGTTKRPPLFTRLPWWVYVLTAGAGYALVKRFAPALAAAAGYPEIGDFLALLAPIVTIGLLLLAAARLYDSDGRNQAPPTGPGQPGEGRNDDDDADRHLSGRQ